MAKKRYIWDEIPWLAPMFHNGRPRAVACSQFGWLMSMKLRPRNLQTASEAIRLGNAARFAAALQSMGGNRWIWIEERRGPLPGVIIPEASNRAARLFSADRAKTFGSGCNYGSQHFLSVRFNPPSGWAAKLRAALLVPEPGETSGEYGPLFDDYVRSVDRLAALLRFLNAEMLEGNELATYLRSTISVNDQPIEIDPYEFLTPQLVDSPLYGGRPLWLGHDHKRLCVRAVQINTYPRKLAAGVLDFGNDTFAGLSELGFRLRRVKRIRTQTKYESVRELEWLTRKAAMTRDGIMLNFYRQFREDAQSPLHNKAATVTLQEVDAMLEDMERDGVMRCQATDNVLIYHEDAREAKRQAEQVEEFLLDNGFGCEINDFSAHDCVLGAIPGKTDVDFVRPAINLMGVAVSAPLTSAWKGDIGTKSPILLYGRTCGTDLFGLSFHIDGANRHGFLCGGTGGGKSTALNALAFGHLTAVKNGRVVRIESGNSGYVCAKLVGGVTFNIGEAGCGVQPLRHIHKPSERLWAHSWIMARLQKHLGTAADVPEVSQAVDTALKILSRMPEDDRTMTSFCLNVPNAVVAQGMRIYTNDGALGHIFDAVDTRSYDAPWINFELSAITGDDEAQAAPALISYLWRFIQRISSSKRPISLQLDEASAYVGGAFEKGLGWGLRTYRKLKTQVIFATQSVLDLSKSNIAHIILNSCPTQIFVQDSAVTSPAGMRVLDELKLTPHDAEIIASMTQAQDYFIHRYGIGKAIVTFDLNTPIARATVCATDDEHYQAARLLEKSSDNFMDDWLGMAGIDAEISLDEVGSFKVAAK